MQEPPSKPRPEPELELKLDLEAELAAGVEPEPEPVVELELEQEPAPASEETIPTLLDSTGAIASPASEESTEDDIPAWDRDPTLAELRPDLDALERAMAVAHGREPGAPKDAATVPESGQRKPPKDEIEDIPEITLDDSINRKVDMAALEKKKRLEKEGIVEETEADAGEPEPSEEERVRQEKSAAELEKIAQGLARAKTIEDVDDKMAETLFGEELSVAAAAVAARVAEEAAAEAAKASEKQAATAPSPKSELEKEFENVWGETPAVEVSIDSELEDQKGGMDISASQRLATVRALNTGNTGSATPKAQPTPEAKPDPIEEQITTSLTQTMKALKVNPDPAAINDDNDDDDERKGGFFSRFRRS